jgi:Family of unknown function (DUF6174)
MPKLSLALLTLLVAGAACETTTAPAEGDNLAAARALWNAKGASSYSYKVNRSCDCVLGGSLMTVTVVNGSVISAEYVDSRLAVDQALLTYVLTVPDLFDLIQDALDRKAAYLAVTYDPIYGYPTHIEIDYSANTMDDEMVLTARELTFP